jgi:alanyl-tRNA synthetase
VPKSRLDDVLEKKKAAEKELSDLKAARSKEEEDAAAAKGEWEKLAKRHEAKVNTLEPQLKAVTEERDALRTVVQEQQEEAIAALPEEVKKLAPAADDYQARSKFLVDVAPIVAKITGTEGGGQPRQGNGPGPKTAPAKPEAKAIADLKTEMVGSGKYAGL